MFKADSYYIIYTYMHVTFSWLIDQSLNNLLIFFPVFSIFSKFHTPTQKFHTFTNSHE